MTCACETLENFMGKGSISCSQLYGGLWEITLNHASKRVKNLPFSARNADIEVALKGLGVEMFSPIKMENATDGKGNRHDRWLTGIRRFTRIKNKITEVHIHYM